MKGINSTDLTKRRAKEEIENILTRGASPIDDPSMRRWITNIIKNGGSVYLMTDFHLYKRKHKGSNQCVKRSDFDLIMNRVRNIPETDLLIYLGDLVDGEFTDAKEVIKEFKDVKCNRIITRGNNDLFTYGQYRDMGFKYVVYSFIYDNIIFSHCPIRIDSDNMTNIHGHLHSTEQRPPTYWIPYKNMIDISYIGGRTKPILLQDALKSIKSYKKIISEDPTHFNESCDVFDMINNEYLYDIDPYDD